MNEGRLDYWKMKAQLSQNAFENQIEQGNTTEALKNLERFMLAKNMENMLNHGVDFSFLNTEGNDVA